jgi:hypothetical protein
VRHRLRLSGSLQPQLRTLHFVPSARQSLAGAGLGHLDSGESYRVDAFAASDPCNRDLYDLRAMLSQAARLENAFATGRGSPWNGLVREFPDLVLCAGALSSSSGMPAEQQLTSMLRRYVSEWRAVPSPLVHRYLATHQPSA